ncbi:outer membrane beta-barrel protein [Chryseobacterium sp. MMS23-Vi53]|uniref:outer membrane beta-barrel protein n=1 Tax=Chryseobacterium sp. MMS23-Vi53 TaxID=3386644 RepID=UPI0039ED443E
MSNDWLNDLRSKMEDHQEQVPEGLWDDIKDELFNEDDAKGVVVGINDVKAKEKAVSKFNYKSWGYRIGGVAAVIAMFFTVGKLLDFNGEKEPSKKPIYANQTQNRPSETSSYPQNPSNEEKRTAVENSLKQGSDLEKINSNISNKNLVKNIFEEIINKTKNTGADVWENIIPENKKENTAENLFNQNKENIAQEQNRNAIEGTKQNEETETHPLLTKEEREWKEQLEKADRKLANHKTNKAWSVGVLTGNASSNSTEQFPGYATLNGTTLSLPEVWGMEEYGENPLMAILLKNQDKKVDATIKHKTPITFGASVNYKLSKKLSVGTGVNYTKLSSELTTGSSSNFIKSDQEIHYVGIPVQVNYNVIEKGAFTGYVTAGGMVEKAVSGNIKTQYVVEGVSKDETTEDISEKPTQFSVNGGVGLQLKVIKNIGIYAEPGVGYHFNDKSSLNTIYKEKPVNFNLKFGIRVLLD